MYLLNKATTLSMMSVFVKKQHPETDLTSYSWSCYTNGANFKVHNIIFICKLFTNGYNTVIMYINMVWVWKPGGHASS